MWKDQIWSYTDLFDLILGVPKCSGYVALGKSVSLALVSSSVKWN